MTTPTSQPVVVDTNVVSYIYRKEQRAEPYLNEMVGRRAVISFQTYEELLYGVLRSNWGERRRNEFLDYVEANYEMIGYDRELVNACARLRAAASDSRPPAQPGRCLDCRYRHTAGLPSAVSRPGFWQLAGTAANQLCLPFLTVRPRAICGRLKGWQSAPALSHRPA